MDFQSISQFQSGSACGITVCRNGGSRNGQGSQENRTLFFRIKEKCTDPECFLPQQWFCTHLCTHAQHIWGHKLHMGALNCSYNSLVDSTPEKQDCEIPVVTATVHWNDPDVKKM